MSAVLRTVPIAGQWRHVLPALIGTLAVVLLLYIDTAGAMVAIWERSGTFAHAYVVVPIALWLVWRKRDALAATAPQPSPLWLLGIAAAALLWLLGELAFVNAATQLAFTAMAVFVVPTIIGTVAARTILFPLAFVFFAVPIGEFMMPWMIVWTADFTVWALRLTGIPVFREGEQLVIPSGTWSVVEACSGIRYLIASVMVGALFAYLHYRTMTRRMLFMAVAVAVPIVANWVRAYLIVLVGHLSGNRLAAGADHLIYGWVFFGLVIAIMFAIGARWSEPEPVATSAVAPRKTAVAGAPAARAATAAVFAAVVVLAVVPPLALRLIDAVGPTGVPRLAGVDRAAADWTPAPPPSTSWRPAFAGAAAERRVGFAGPDGAIVGLYVGYWRKQGYDNKLVSSENTLVKSNDAEWKRVASGTRSITLDGSEVTLRTASLRGSPVPGVPGAQRLAAWQVYWINGTLTASEWRAKAWGAWHKLVGRGEDGAVIVFYTPLVDRADADETLAEFGRTHLTGLAAQLQRVRDAD